MCFHTLHAEQHDDALRPANNNNANSWKHWHAESADLWLHIARHPLKLTHTHIDAHSRKQRRSDWRGAAEKNAAITQKVVGKISERSREQKPQLPCCCCCGCCPYSWLYCFSQLWASCGPSQGAGGSQFKRRMSLQWFAELLRRKVCYAFY